jgi:hypothetical protein
LKSADDVAKLSAELVRYAVPDADRPGTVVHNGAAIETLAKVEATVQEATTDCSFESSQAPLPSGPSMSVSPRPGRHTLRNPSISSNFFMSEVAG